MLLKSVLIDLRAHNFVQVKTSLHAYCAHGYKQFIKPRAFDTINHELLIANLHAYGFTREYLLIILSYHSDCSQPVKIASSFRSWSKLTQGVPQRSVLGPLLFNIYLNDLFFSLKDIEVCNFADDTTPFVCDLYLNSTLNKLEENSAIALTWFETNCMKLNIGKCHLLVSGLLTL